MNRYLLGAHLSISKGFEETFSNAQEIGASAIQIFIGSNRSWHSSALTQEKISDFLKYKTLTNVSMVLAHASYLINLASANPSVLKNSIKALSQDLLKCDELNIPYLVLHPGACTTLTRETGMLQIIDSLNAIFKNTASSCQILLETMAGQGSTLGSSFEEISFIINGVQSKKRVGVCWDTCHLFASGYSLSEIDSLITHFDNICGLDYLKAIHLNDSKSSFNSHVDRHANIGTGLIDMSDLKQLLHHKKLKHLPFILETPLSETSSYLIYKKEIELLLSP